MGVDKLRQQVASESTGRRERMRTNKTSHKLAKAPSRTANCSCATQLLFARALARSLTRSFFLCQFQLNFEAVQVARIKEHEFTKL